MGGIWEPRSVWTIWYRWNLRRVGEGRLFISDWRGLDRFTSWKTQQVSSILKSSPVQMSALASMTMTELWTDGTPRRLDRQQNGWMLQEHILKDEEREELRKWMRKKQQERLAVYQKHRESLRERERKPFSSTVTVVRTITSIICQNI